MNKRTSTDFVKFSIKNQYLAYLQKNQKRYSKLPAKTKGVPTTNLSTAPDDIKKRPKFTKIFLRGVRKIKLSKIANDTRHRPRSTHMTKTQNLKKVLNEKFQNCPCFITLRKTTFHQQRYPFHIKHYHNKRMVCQVIQSQLKNHQKSPQNMQTSYDHPNIKTSHRTKAIHTCIRKHSLRSLCKYSQQNISLQALLSKPRSNREIPKFLEIHATTYKRTFFYCLFQ
eukprot:TRINITY_DN4924_c0_g2_i2.p2 TRINITY_DN4924_c0_g2~~TRINITY_DN4924_c0_g2_i2.p2  ORF type:complete len:225 (-),score=-13.86 TRINITY_DN4924_c0_g2_i2:499-1173(-)